MFRNDVLTFDRSIIFNESATDAAYDKLIFQLNKMHKKHFPYKKFKK